MKAVLWLVPMALSAVAVEQREDIHREFRGVRQVVVKNVSGFIHVTPSSGDELRADIVKRIKADTPELAERAKRDVRLEVSEEQGTATFQVEYDRDGDGHRGYSVAYDFELRVPRQAQLRLRTVNGAVDVKEIVGDFDLSSVNGPITIRETEGVGRMHTVNGQMQAWFRRSPRAPCSFRTVNGRIEAWFPPDLAAEVWFKTLHGGVYTDFESVVMPGIVQAGERRGAKYVYRSDRSARVRVGQGGPELRFETLNGEIHIRSREK